MAFTDDDLERLKKVINDPSWTTANSLATIFNLPSLLDRLKAAEDYKKTHLCQHREPHGALKIDDIGCQYDIRWCKAAGK